MAVLSFTLNCGCKALILVEQARYLDPDSSHRVGKVLLLSGELGLEMIELVLVLLDLRLIIFR